ncbi:2'-5' RNA ligase family protein [Flavobacterium olei]|uniref:2'-5' RNA ligase family protein n=1 Tax=Flavobacterium olei TaxID=1886782 RepID=UPI00321BC3AF
MKKIYSVAIYPSPDIIDLVKTMKGYLRSKIEWYNSCNSTAHITICEFELDASELEKLKQKLSEICNTFTPFQVYLDHFDSYDNAGAFFIGLNEDPTPIKPKIKKTQKAPVSTTKKVAKPNQSIEKPIEKKTVEKPTEDLIVKTKLKTLMKKTQEGLKISRMKKSNDPHITIGRKLSLEKIKIASEIFTNIERKFLCKEMVLREFDPLLKQFVVIDTFPFGSNPEPEFVQGSLF